MPDLSSEIAIVTGGGRGIGRSIATALGAAGAYVAVLARTAAEVDRTARLIEEGGSKALALSVDVTDAEAVEATVATVAAKLGTPTLLVNNAGTALALGETWEQDPATWWRDVETSVRAAFLCSRAVLPTMLAHRRGRIVNVSSYAGTRPAAYNSAYGAAKAALANFSESLAAELSGRGVSVFAITPGRVRTAMVDAMVETGLFPHLDEGDWIDPSRAGALVTLLASGRADVLSGRFLHVLDDVDLLIAQSEEIERADTYVLRLRR